MSRFREKLYRFMYGRYGTDNLNNFFTVSFFVIWIAEIITMAVMPNGIAKSIASMIFGAVTILIMSLSLFRMMSRNIYKRRRENEVYLKAKRAVKRFCTFNTSTRTKSKNFDNAEYIFRDCTKCGSTLRLPRKEGKHSVKCPRCSHSFFVKSK